MCDKFKNIASWLIVSDYCIDNKKKSNDVATYTIFPYIQDFQKMQRSIKKLSPTDIKNKRSINPYFITYLKDDMFFHFSFIINDVKALTFSKEKDGRRIALSQINNLEFQIDNWVNSLSISEEYSKKLKKKLLLVKEKMNRSSANVKLYRNTILLSFFAGYISFLIARYSSPKRIGWFSDRDAIIESYQNIAADLLSMNYNGLCQKHSISSTKTKIIFGIPSLNEKNEMWYDELIKIPDHIAGTISDWDIKKMTVVKKSSYV